MRKLLCSLLAIMLLTTAAMADAPKTETVGKDGNSNQDVTATYELNRENSIVVNVYWGSMQFKFNEPDKTWNTAELKWYPETNAGGTWSCEGGADIFTVENRSSVAVGIEYDFAPDTDRYPDVTKGEIQKQTDDADPMDISVGQSIEFKFIPSGFLPIQHESDSDYVKNVGTITVRVVSPGI